MKILLKCSGLIIFTYLYTYFICYMFDNLNDFAEVSRVITELYITTFIVGCLIVYLYTNKLL